jgi:hypothetical protein
MTKSPQAPSKQITKHEPKATKDVPAPGSLTTAIHLPRTTWELLRAVAFHRAQADGGRVSVSRLITELAEGQRAAFEQELASK